MISLRRELSRNLVCDKGKAGSRAIEMLGSGTWREVSSDDEPRGVAGAMLEDQVQMAMIPEEP
jgi:hypothetical protein